MKHTYGDFDGLELNLQWAERYATTSKNQNYYSYYETPSISMPWKEFEITYTFNNLAQTTKIEKNSYSAMPFRQDGIAEANNNIFQNQTSWKSQVTEYQYRADQPLWPETITTTHTDNISNHKITRVETYSYDTKGNVLTYKKPNGQTETYTYDSTYSLPLTTTLWQNASTKITTTNTLSTDKKSILTTETKSNDVTVSKSVYSYDSFGQVTVQNDYKDAANYVTTNYSYNYATSALPVQVSVAGVKTANGVIAAGSPGFAAGTVARKQSYNKRGWLMSETDANGKTTSYSYDAVGRLTGVTFPDGSGLSYSYTVASTSMVTYTDQAGNQWRCAYGKSGKLKTVTDLTTNQLLQSNTYDREDRLVKQVIYGGSSPDQTTYYRYDTDGRMIELERVDTAGNTIYQELYQYEDGSGKVTKTVTGDTNAPSVKTTSYWDNMGNTVKTGIFRNGVEEIDTFSYDYLGNQTQSKTAFSASKKRAYTTQTAYDHAGRVLSTTNTMGKTAYKTYDWLGSQLTDKDLKGNVTTMTYDVLGRLLRTSTPMDSKQTSQTDYIYDPNGNVTREKVLTGSSTARITDYIYDSLGRLAQVKGNAKQEGQTGADQFQYTNYTYDALGNIKTMSIGAGTNWHTTQYTYDRYSRLTQYKDALNQAESYSYDLNGNLTSKTDRRGVTTANTYDAMGRLTESTAGQDSLAFTYTKTSQRRTATSNGQTTTYTYDEVGNLVKEVTPVATKTMTYGIGGLRSQFVVTANGKTYLTNTYDYDPMGRMSKVDGMGFGAASAHYSYGTSGKLVSVTYGNDTEAHYTYNKANLPTEVKTGLGSYPGVPLFQYTYGREGNQISKTDDRGSYTTYAYDGLNRLVEENQTGTLGNFSKSYAYDAFGNRQSMTVDGKTTSYIYDANNRLLSTAGGGAASYTYDANGNMTQATIGTGVVVTCTYDGFNRLKKVSDSSGETVYTYDADGIRMSKSAGGSTERYVYDNGQLVLTVVPAATNVYTGTIPASGYGNTTFGMAVGEQYFVEINGTMYSGTVRLDFGTAEAIMPYVTFGDGPDDGRPEEPEDPSGPNDSPAGFGTFVILEAGDVTIVSPDGGVSGTISGPAGAQVKVYTSDPRKTTTAYIRGLSLIYGGSLMDGYNYHYDAHGNVVQLSRGRSTVFKDYYYDAFGVEQNADPADTNPFRYCGEQYDTETGNYYLRARYYTPRAGRFTQEDPIRDGLNWYAYCAGNPIMLADPSGCIGEWIKTGIHWAIHAGERSVNALPGIDTASIGAYCLNMFEDPNQEGVYHASRDCWQAGAGYNSLYDFLFDLGTEMRVTRTVFTSEGVDYAVWAWKGDYINLGAGAELGIYRKSAIPGHWDVDKNLAMPMTLKLTDKEDNLIFRYAPKEPQWWITGFKPSMQNVDPDDLKATFTVDFSQNSKMFEAFKNVGGDGWYFDSKTYKATLVFN